MSVKQEILRELNATADKLEMELTREINSLGSYGLALAILNRGGLTSKDIHKMSKAVVKIHDAIAAVHNTK